MENLMMKQIKILNIFVVFTLIALLMLFPFSQTSLAVDKSQTFFKKIPEQSPVPELLQAPDDVFEIVDNNGKKPNLLARFPAKNGYILFVQIPNGDIVLTPRGKAAAIILNNMLYTYQFSPLEIFEALGGKRTDAPPQLRLAHEVQYGSENANRKRQYPSIDEISSLENPVLGTDTAWPGEFFDVGVVTGNHSNVCSDEATFKDWENYFRNLSDLAPPYIELAELGSHGKAGLGEWEGDANIKLGPTGAGSILVCNKNFNDSFVRYVVSDEVSPGFFLTLFEITGKPFPNVGYGIVFKGPLLRRIRMTIRKITESPGGGNIPDGPPKFWWAASY